MTKNIVREYYSRTATQDTKITNLADLFKKHNVDVIPYPKKQGLEVLNPPLFIYLTSMKYAIRMKEMEQLTLGQCFC